MEAGHTVFHKTKLLSAGTVAGVIFGGKRIQVFRKAFQGIVKGQFGKMKTAD